MTQNEKSKLLQELLDIIRGIRPHFEKTGLSCLEDCDDAIEIISSMLPIQSEPSKEPEVGAEEQEIIDSIKAFLKLPFSQRRYFESEIFTNYAQRVLLLLDYNRRQLAACRKELTELKSQQRPCSPQCYHHRTHPCENCGRIGGYLPAVLKQKELAEAKKQMDSDWKFQEIVKVRKELADLNTSYAERVGTCKELMAQRDKYRDELAEKDKEIKNLESVLTHIALKCLGHDGYNTVKGLKKLVDTIKDISVNKEAI